MEVISKFNATGLLPIMVDAAMVVPAELGGGQVVWAVHNVFLSLIVREGSMTNSLIIAGKLGKYS